MRTLLFLLLVTTLAVACEPAKQGDTTRWGGNERIILDEPLPLSRIEGIVHFHSTQALSNVLVEVIPNPDAHNDDDSSNSKKRIAACITSRNGKFALRLPPGRYELRFSLDTGWNVTSTVIVVKKGAPRRYLDISMQLGT